MPNITPRPNKDGSTTYLIRVFRGYDSNGKQLKPYTTSFKLPKGLSPKREVDLFAARFEEQCKRGYNLDNKQTFAEYAEYVIQLKERSGVKAQYDLLIPQIGGADKSRYRTFKAE